MTDIKTSVLYVSGQPALVTLDYFIQSGLGEVSEFRLSYYPHKLAVFQKMLDEIFSKNSGHIIFGDFKELSNTSIPAFYIHVMKKN